MYATMSGKTHFNKLLSPIACTHSPGLTRWKERTNSSTLLSNLPYMLWHMEPTTHTKNTNVFKRGNYRKKNALIKSKKGHSRMTHWQILLGRHKQSQDTQDAPDSSPAVCGVIPQSFKLGTHTASELFLTWFLSCCSK